MQVDNKHALAEKRGMPRREVANLVKEQWKCIFMECDPHPNPDLDLDPIVQMGNRHNLSREREYNHAQAVRWI